MNDFNTWSQRVSAYVDELSEVAETIDLILDETRIRTIGLRPGEVDASTQQLAASVERLETMIARREELLRADDAPQRGLSLSEKLLYSRRIDDARLAQRCGEVAKAIDTTHHRATALFVCQYHLTHFQQELLQRLSGATAPPTYGPGHQTRTATRNNRTGGLFNDAA